MPHAIAKDAKSIGAEMFMYGKLASAPIGKAEAGQEVAGTAFANSLENTFIEKGYQDET